MNDFAPTDTVAGMIVVGGERPAAPVHQTIRLGKLFAIADQIQALCLARKTAEIRVVNVVPTGHINVVRGEVVHATFGNQTGVDAAIALINLGDPDSEIEADLSTRQRTITMPYPQILLEAANRKDETSMTGFRVADKAGRDPSRVVLWVILGAQSIDCPLEPGLTLLGRSDLSDITVADPTVSKRHACIQVSGDEVILRDLNSTNGTFVEGKRIEEAHLTGRVHLRFGTVSAVLMIAADGRAG